jgi:hypothetical protein
VRMDGIDGDGDGRMKGRMDSWDWGTGILGSMGG